MVGESNIAKNIAAVPFIVAGMDQEEEEEEEEQEEEEKEEESLVKRLVASEWEDENSLEHLEL